jgi:hypothetical protein
MAGKYLLREMPLSLQNAKRDLFFTAVDKRFYCSLIERSTIDCRRLEEPIMTIKFLRRSDGIYIAETESSFTIGTAGRDANDTDYSLDKESIRISEKQIMSRAIGIPLSHLFFLDQEHGDTVAEVSHPSDESSYVFATADAMITNTKGFCLVIRTADCIPVILADPTALCAGAVHSGWKSTEKRIAVRTARRLKENYGARYQRLRAYILPGIGAAAYKVGDDFADRFPHSAVRMADGLHINLAGEIQRSLIEEGIPSENIFLSNLCTFEQNDLFFSHRKGDPGRNLNFVMII